MKGAFYIQQWFALLGAGVLAAILPLIITSQFLKISPEVEENEFENKAILLANVLMANPDLIYSNNRGMFDKNELETNMLSKSGSFNDLTEVCYSLLRRPPLPTSLCASRYYPETFSLVLVKDTDEGEGWLSLIPPARGELENKLLECFKSITKSKTQDLFDETKDISKTLNIQNCDFQRNSHILNKQGFPISIMSDPSRNKIDMGWMKVMVVE